MFLTGLQKNPVILSEELLLPTRFAITAAATTAVTTTAAATAAAVTAAITTTTTAATVAAATTAATTAITAIFAWTSFVDGQVATVEFLPVELRNRCFTFLFRRHFDKAETA
jgi:hypothetical protein